MELFLLSLLNGLSYGLLLFMLASGLTLIFSMMGVLNFAHASFYMLGAYVGYAVAQKAGFVLALLLSPLLVGCLGALFERVVLRRVHPLGHVPELLVTFGLAYVLLEVVQLIWGRTAVPFSPPAWLQGPAWTWAHMASGEWRFFWGAAPEGWCAAQVHTVCTTFPATRAFMMGASVGMLFLMWLLLTTSRLGLVVRAALTHPQMVEALGHNVPRVFMGVFGAGCALAALAGVIGGSTFVTEPAMAASVGAVVFVVVVVGGVGSLRGAFIASLLIGVLQTLAVSWDQTLADMATKLLSSWGAALPPTMLLNSVMQLSASQLAPVLPYALMVLVLVWRPQGLLGEKNVEQKGVS
jgi:branched-chain amino acid transport system permease protein